MTALELTLLYLSAAVLGVVVFRSLKLPPMLGYLVVGVVIGPNALALAENSEMVRHLGEFGVVFLMFVIGLEFNLHKLRAMRGHVFGLGLFQVLLTVVLATAGSSSPVVRSGSGSHSPRRRRSATRPEATPVRSRPWLW